MHNTLRFHLDEHVDPAIAEGLRRYGIDVTTTVEAQLRTKDDTVHLALRRAIPHQSTCTLPYRLLEYLNLSTFVNNVKTVSSRLLRKAYARELARWYRQPVLWSRSYYVLSCGGAPLSVLRQYIEQQGNGAA